MPVKTLHLTNYWHERSGGISTFYRQLMKAAEQQHRRMVLIVPGAREEVHGFGHCTLYQIAAPPSWLGKDYRTIYPREFFLPGSRIQRILAEEQPDLVEICDKYSLVYLAPLLRHGLARDVNLRPVVIGLSCERMDENFATYVSRSRWGQLFTRLYMRHIYFPFFDHHLAVSENTAAELKSVADGHLVERGVWVRPMGVDIERFSPTKRNPELRKRLLANFRNAAEATLLLYVGRLAPEKNLNLLISTMAELAGTGRDFRMIVVGDGIARDEFLQNANAAAPGKFLLLGHVARRDELASIYASCNAFVHPNPTEPFGIAPLEAMASGLALVAPDQGGVTSYANDCNAFLAPAAPTDFARAILQACDGTAETARKVETAIVTANALAWPNVAQMFFSLYDQLYQLRSKQLPVQSAKPWFVSLPASRSRAGMIRSASNFAQAGFAAYAWAHRVLWPNRCNHQFLTDLGSTRTR